MSIEMIPLTKLRASPANPRKSFDPAAIEGLAQSIKTDGLLQNFVAARPRGAKRKFDIIAGERRLRAMRLLVEQGDLPKDVPVPVEIRDELCEGDALRLATVENIQREDLSPLEEAEALNVLVGGGDKLDDIIALTGLSETTIKRRLALLNLSKGVKAALCETEITLAQAEALSLGGHDEQDGLLEEVTGGWYSSPADITERIIGELPSLALAIFPKEDYRGSFTTDLLAEDDTTYFDDVEQFFELQKSAALQLVTELDREHDWTELVEGSFQSWGYREAEKNESGGVVVNLRPDGKVETHEGLIRKSIDESVSRAFAPRASYAKTVREHIAMHKSAAVQAELLKNPRKAKEVGVALMLYRAASHGCLDYFERRREEGPHVAAINDEAGALLALLGGEEEGATFRDLLRCAYSKEAAYELVQALADDELERLFVFLAAINFGQSGCCELDTRESSIFNRVAVDLGVDMRRYWIPDVWFLSRRTMSQLAGILTESAMTRLFGSGGDFKKKELVPRMVAYFRKVRDMTKPQLDQVQARDWLPGVFAFPAIDPDAPAPQVETEIEAGAEAEETNLAEAA